MALSAALSGYMPFPRCYGKISQVEERQVNARTLITYEIVSMGLDSGSTSDKHRASNPTTGSALDILRCSIPFATVLWISVSCVAVNLNVTNSIALLSGLFHDGVSGSSRGKIGWVAFGDSVNVIASGS